MSATKALRANLKAAGIEYGCLGEYHTRVHAGGLWWHVEDSLNGTLNATTYDYGMTPDEVMRIITGHGTAHVLTVCDEDGVGHSKCSRCHHIIGEWFRFCPWCGRRFTTIERTYRP